MPVSEVYWIGPIAGDLIQTLFLAVMYAYSRESLTKGLLGGIQFGFFYAITSLVGSTLILTSLTNVAPTFLWWVWAGFQTLYAVSVGAIFSIGWDEED